MRQMKTFNAITFTGDLSIGNQGYVKFKKIHSQHRHIEFINRKFPDWRFITFYDKATNERFLIKKADIYTMPAPKIDFLPTQK